MTSSLVPTELGIQKNSTFFPVTYENVLPNGNIGTVLSVEDDNSGLQLWLQTTSNMAVVTQDIAIEMGSWPEDKRDQVTMQIDAELLARHDLRIVDISCSPKKNCHSSWKKTGKHIWTRHFPNAKMELEFFIEWASTKRTFRLDPKVKVKPSLYSPSLTKLNIF